MYKTLITRFLLLLWLHLSGVAAISAEPEYEEIAVYMRIQGVGAFEINAYFSYENNRLYLPVVDLFQFLKINAEPDPQFEVVKGFLVDEARRYVIDHASRTIQIDGKSIILSENDLLKTESGLYLYSEVYGRAFGLYCTFNFRSMAVELKTSLELPAIRELRLQQMRKNIERLKGEVTVDTTYGRRYHLFRFGMVDWSLSSTQVSRSTTDTRAALGIGSELLGGETNVFLNYSTRDGFNERNQQYQWRWANNQTKFIRQVRAGKIGSGSIASMYDPLIGVSATNAPTTYRRSFGAYIISDFTEPGWTVELYINNVIVDYQTADASGFYTFDVPLVYGTSQVMLKFYGPYGEERIKEQFINIPFNFLPQGQLEYTITGGLVQDGKQTTFAKGEINYGVNRFITLGAGVEHLSSITSGSEIPFLSASITPFRNLLISGEYAHGVRTKALMSYRLPSNLTFELNYSNFVEAQQAIRFNYLEERKATLAIPLKLSFLKGFTRFSFKQNVYSMLTYNTADMTFSTYFGPVSANLSGFASWIDQNTPFVYGNLAMGIRLGRGFTLRPQSQFDVNNREVINIKAELEKRILRSGYFSIGYENNFRSVYQSIDFTFRWDLRFAQTNFASRFSNDAITTSQGARGSFAFGSGNGYIHADNRSTMGRGGLSITPFLDINHNSIHDPGEPMVSGIKVRISGGRLLKRTSDSLIRVVELEPYTSYLIELEDEGLENIAWQIKNKAISVFIDPNQFKKMEIPVLPMGEANGMVYLQEEKALRGLGRITINFYKSDGTFFHKTMSESDGFITFLGLPPGEYTAKIDPAQLTRLEMWSEPNQIDFEIQPHELGDIVDGLDFILHRRSAITPSELEPGIEDKLQEPDQ